MTAAPTLTRCVRVADIAAATGVSRSKAYEMLRACAVAAGIREGGQRGLLLVPVDVWERYFRQEVLRCGSTSAAERGGAGTTRRRARAPTRARDSTTVGPPRMSLVTSNDLLSIRPTAPLGRDCHGCVTPRAPRPPAHRVMPFAPRSALRTPAVTQRLRFSSRQRAADA